ncbi:MAG: acyl-CoA dehydrogenase family protein [Acidimicrobiales bacterium]|nr:acyl-CoA dehydrogenase family protein [Acidimicrobiales bacterium]
MLTCETNRGVAADASSTAALDAVRELRPAISARSAEIEQDRALPQDLVDDLVAAGAWRMFVPRRYGGEGLSLPECFDVLVELTRADSSVGWVLMIGFMGATFPTRFPEDLARRLYDDAPTMKVRGVFAPTGVAVPVEGGYSVSGQWAFASGTRDVDWVAATCLVIEDGAPRLGPDGVPEIVMAFAPARDAVFCDNWDVVGMRGTNSEDFVLDGVFVPTQFVADATARGTEHTIATASLPFWVSVAPGHAAVAVGIAKGAIDDLLAVVEDKRPTYNPLSRTAEDPVFQHRLGEIATRLDAARIYAHQVTSDIWDRAVAGEPIGPEDNLRFRAMAARVTSECVDIVETAFRLAGKHSIGAGASLQRRLRDIEVAAQHFAVAGREYRLLGAALTGAEIEPKDLA